MTGVFTFIVFFCAVVSTVAWAAVVVKVRMENGKCRTKDCPQFSILHSKFSIHTAVFLFFAAIATLSAQKTNSPPRGGSVNQGTGNRERVTGNREQGIGGGSRPIRHSTFSILHSQFPFRLESVTTNNSYSYAMPTNATCYDRWWKRGAYEDVVRLDLGGMAFPLNGELLDSLWIYSWGMAGAHLGNASNRLVATGVPMSAVPGRSQFWSSDATNGAKLLTWENFFLNRDTNTPISAQRV